MSTTCTTAPPTVFGPTESTLRELRGIRLFSDEHGAGGAGDGGQGGGDGGQQQGQQQQGQQGGGGNAGGQQGQQQGQQQTTGQKREASQYERDLRAEAQGYRTERNAANDRATAAERERDELRLWRTQREQSDAIRTAAGDKGNAALLIDSGLFRREAEAASLDYSKTDAVKEFVSKFVDAHPEYGQTAGLPGSGGPSRHGGGTDPSLEQQLEQATKEGRTEDAIALKRRIAANR